MVLVIVAVLVKGDSVVVFPTDVVSVIIIVVGFLVVGGVPDVVVVLSTVVDPVVVDRVVVVSLAVLVIPAVVNSLEVVSSVVDGLVVVVILVGG